MVEAVSYLYNIGKDINLSKLQKSDYFQTVNKDPNFVFAKIDSVFMIVFKDGRIRLVHESVRLDKLERDLSSASVKLKELIEELGKKTGSNSNTASIITRGGRESYTLTEYHRPSGDTVETSIVQQLGIFAPEKVLGEYQRDRILTQAGETIGRQIGKVKDKKQLAQTVVKYIESSGLGVAEFFEPKDTKEKNLFAVFRVYESAFSYGLPPIGKPLCNLTRGVIRGAYVSYFNQENVNVVETRCWGIGDVVCEFKVHLLNV